MAMSSSLGLKKKTSHMNYLLYNIIAHLNMNFYLVMNGRTEEKMEGTDKNRPSRNLNLENIKHYIYHKYR